MKRVEKQTKVSIAYTLMETSGRILEEIPPSHPFVYIHGFNNIIPGLEHTLEGRFLGETFTVKIPYTLGYGPYREDLVFKVPKEELEEIGELWLGMELEMFQENDMREFQLPDNADDFFDSLNLENDTESDGIYVIKEIYKDSILVDGNHPFAGKNLFFEVQVVDIEEPSYTELETGYPDEENYEDENYNDEDYN